MSRKTPNNPPPQNSLVRAMLVPILLFVGILAVALVVMLFGDRLTGNGNGVRAEGGNVLDEATMQRFREEWDQLGVAFGPEDAPVVVREFADYQCPACGAFAPTAKRIRNELVAAGDVRFVFFDFPLPMHPHARSAAAAARCAGRQGAYWTYHDKLFRNQADWSSAGDPTNDFLDLAVESGIRVEPFRQCLVQGATEQIVVANARIASQVGVVSTPTVLVGPRTYSGVVNYSTLAAEIQNQLAAAENTGSVPQADQEPQPVDPAGENGQPGQPEPNEPG